jgi:hypothetical protein
MAPGGPDDPPKNTEPATNGTNANKLPGFTPAQPDPNINPNSLRAAGTGGGGGATTKQNLQGKIDYNWGDNQRPKAEIKADTRSDWQKEQAKLHTNEVNWSTPRAVAANILESGNIIGAGMDVKSSFENGTDRKGYSMSPEQALFKATSTALLFTPIKFTPTATTGRVFWSGGNVAKTSATDFAATNGMKTLEMTPVGKIMEIASPYIPNSISAPIWNKLSTNFAKGATGEANVFLRAAGPRPTSIWITLEKPILEQKGVKIATRIIP